MTGLRHAAQQALVAMKSANHVNYSWACVEAVAVLEAALAEDALQRLTSVSQEIEAALAEREQEPVAWMDREGDLYKMPEIKNWAPPHTMLYTSPPQRKPLTDEEINALELPPSGTATVRDLVRLIESAHGIKGEA
jgi:hypothetical protein